MSKKYSEYSTSELLSIAQNKKQSMFGRKITFSPKVFIPLTMLCRDRCGYCTFAKAPAKISSPFLSIEEVLNIAHAGAELGCTEALFTLGEKPEMRYKVAQTFLDQQSTETTIHYLHRAASAVLSNTELLPHLNAGALNYDEFTYLRDVSASQGMMIESTNPNLLAHRIAPDKSPERRLDALRDAGKAQVPFTTGLLIGIGETENDRIESLTAIRDIAQEYGHIQEVIIQNFLPKPHTAMADYSAPTKEEYLRAIAIARIILPLNIHLQAPPNLSDDIDDLLSAGIDDLGGISPLTIDHVNPERPWPNLRTLERQIADSGLFLVPRLPVYPEYASRKWLSEEVDFKVRSNSDSMGFARGDSWLSGGESEPPPLIGSEVQTKYPKWHLVTELSRKQVTSEITEICDDALKGHLPEQDQIESLFTARGSDFAKVVQTADQLRQRISGETVTFVSNRNINYTNVCTFKCRFCAFSKGPLSLNLRGNPYLLDLDEVTSRVVEAEQLGATEVCLQGGIHPSFDGDYYLQIIDAVKKGSETIHIHAFSALEIHEGSRRLGVELKEYLKKCQEAGLKSLPGTAAEILDDEVREQLCPDKIKTQRWLEIHRAAHEVGLKSNITIMFGSLENPKSWAQHIAITRDLQRDTGGFTEFVPLPFVHMASPIYLQKKARKGPTFREAILMHAVARISYQDLVPNIQASWVKMGVHGARQLLQAGTNDLGGTLIDENISRAAGAIHGQALTRKDFEELVAPLGRPLAQRSTFYELL